MLVLAARDASSRVPATACEVRPSQPGVPSCSGIPLGSLPAAARRASTRGRRQQLRTERPRGDKREARLSGVQPPPHAGVQPALAGIGKESGFTGIGRVILFGLLTILN